jgi:hypothetical protein
MPYNNAICTEVRDPNNEDVSNNYLGETFGAQSRCVYSTMSRVNLQAVPVLACFNISCVSPSAFDVVVWVTPQQTAAVRCADGDSSARSVPGMLGSFFCPPLEVSGCPERLGGANPLLASALNYSGGAGDAPEIHVVPLQPPNDSGADGGSPAGGPVASRDAASLMLPRVLSAVYVGCSLIGTFLSGWLKSLLAG